MNNEDRFSWITTKQTIWVLSILTALLFAGFILCKPLVGGTYLDGLSKVDKVKCLVLLMSVEEKTSHMIMTLVWDMLFPFMYGGLFIALTLKYTGKISPWFSLPAILVIPVDLMENITQAYALSGKMDLLGLKSVLTPMKFCLIGIAVVIIVTAFVRGRIKNRKTEGSGSDSPC